MLLPKSVARWSDPIAIGIVVVGLYILCRTQPISTTQLALVLCVAISLLLCIFELFRLPWRGARQPALSLKAIFRRAAVAWIGTMAGLGLVLFFWWLLPQYKRSFYAPIFDVMPYFLPLAVMAITACIFYTEWRLGPADDANRHLGLVVLGRWREANWRLIRDGLLGSWLVKGFFLPLNFCWLIWLMAQFRGKEVQVLDMDWSQAVFTIDVMIMAALAVAIIPGYLFSARLFNNHIRQADHSWFGWMVTLFCYEPLSFGIGRGVINFHPFPVTPEWAQPWAVLLDPSVAYLAGGFILFCDVFHYWGEAAFGLRSSNLTNRGIITNGPYRFFKHPVYGVKCIAWFVIWLPILTGGSLPECVRLSLLWWALCIIYGMRAWVEERLLSKDPDYVAYALWIDGHGLLSWLGRLIPPLSFRWRLEHWQSVRARPEAD